MITWQSDAVFPIDNELVIAQWVTFPNPIFMGEWLQSVVLPIGDRWFYIVGFIWLLVVIWTLKDSVYRSSSLLFQVFSVLVVGVWTPLVWLPIYLAIRPLWYKHERAYWKMVMQWYTIIDTAQTDSTEKHDTSYYAESEIHHTIKPTKKDTEQIKKRRTKTPRKHTIVLDE